MIKSNTKNTYEAPRVTVECLKVERSFCQSGIKAFQDMDEESLFEESFN